MPKRSPSLFQRHRPSWSAPVEFLSFGLYFLCAVLLVLSRIGHGVLEGARDELVDLSAPFLELASVPAIEARRAVDRARLYVRVHQDAVGEVDRLTKQNEELKQWRWRTQLLERKVAHLRKLLHAAEEPALVYTTGQVIADARGPFVRSALVNLGRNDGLRIGYAVINGDGLVGRTVEAGDSVARVLLLNDLNSRIPVVVGPRGARGLALGDNSPELQLGFLEEGAEVYAGDEVYTSGSDGVLPRGLRVGVVAGEPGTFKIRPFADLNSLDAVSVLFFDAPALKRTDPEIVAGNRGPLSASPDAAPDADRTAAAPAPPLPPVAAISPATISPPIAGQAQAER
ncbi:rod shape-determining protein MreC [Methyloceanibacter caenitepidi]|uniref:Cell shape-determining protein MreC n=1 Tax=Methyloceanibacter caenitepidi TaxID=1384459 RepID=A0A0A8K2R2_9HYPH|nr:rod shape-determining protein MreC [Methyloceanibacter caenitepidi]BAQ17076.1 rod shape-determining protein MreC [Methyloceanibacter caenitepidi]